MAIVTNKVQVWSFFPGNLSLMQYRPKQGLQEVNTFLKGAGYLSDFTLDPDSQTDVFDHLITATSSMNDLPVST